MQVKTCDFSFLLLEARLPSMNLYFWWIWEKDKIKSLEEIFDHKKAKVPLHCVDSHLIKALNLCFS